MATIQTDTVLTATHRHGCLPLAVALHHMLSRPLIGWPQLHCSCCRLDQTQPSGITEQQRCHQQQCQAAAVLQPPSSPHWVAVPLLALQSLG